MGREKVNILMVDDQPGKLLSYEVMLSELGENLIKATSAREALDRLLKNDIAVVLVDVSMPEISGFELADMIRQHPRFERTSILFISAVHLTDPDRLKGYERGAVDYISVPVVPELLRAKVSVFAEIYRKTNELDRLNRELEHRVAERTRELRESENQFRTVANSIPQLAWMANPDGSIFWHNQRWYDYTGATPEQSEGWGWRSFVGSETAELLAERWKSLVQAGEPFEMEVGLRGQDGVHRWFLMQATPVRDSQGIVQRWFGTHTNVHEQRELHRDLEETQERLVMAQKAAACGTFEWDIPRGTRTWSAELAELYGFGSRPVIFNEHEWLDCLLPEDREVAQTAVRKAFETGIFEAEFRIRRHSTAEIRWMSARGGVRLDSSGKAVRMAGLSIDVTRLKQAEEELQKAHDELEARVQVRTAELKVAEQGLRRLSGRLMRIQDDERRRIARELHDSVGQYLVATKMTLSMLTATSTVEPAVDAYLSDAVKQLDHAIAETRTMSYLLHPPLLDETGLESAIAWYAEGFAKRSGIAVSVDISPELGRLESDAETALFRVVQECLTNIHRHSGSSTASIQLTRESDEVKLVVRDWGNGTLNRTSDALDGPAGVGIGIEGMRERVRQLRGRLDIVSQPGIGTVVSVAVPDSARTKTSAAVYQAEAS